VTDATKAVLFNALPLALLGAVYATVAITLCSALWRDRDRAHPLDWVFALVFAGIAIAAGILAVLVASDRHPVGGHVWISLAAVVVALLPGLALVARGRGRGAAGGVGRALAAEARSTSTRRELEAVARISTQLGKAVDPVEVARPLVREATQLLNLGFAGVVLVDETRNRATGVYGELHGQSTGWWAELDLDLRREPSGIASAVFDAAPVTVFDVASSPLVNKRLVELVGAVSGAWIPMIAEESVTGVLAVTTTDEKRAFGADEMALLTALAAEGALALSRLRSGEALSDALAENERRLAEASTEQERQARIQLGFAKVASLLGEPVSLEESYAAAAAAAADVLGADGAALLAPAGETLATAGSHRLPESIRPLTIPRVVVETSSARHLLAAPALPEDERFEASWRRAGIASLLAIPVPGDAGVILLALFTEPRQFTQDDLALAGQVALAARGVLDRSRLFEAERASRSLSQRLARGGARLLRELDPAVVLEAAVAEAAALLEADAATLTQPGGSGLVISAAAGKDADAATGATGPAVGWPAGDVVHSGQPLAYHDVTADVVDPMIDRGFHAYLGVPLPGADGAVDGVLSVYSRRPRTWRDEERDALAALAANAAVALSNAELYRRVALEREQGLAILANIADGIVAVDRDDHVVVWNQAAETITGVPAAEAIGRSPAQVLQRELGAEDGSAAGRVAIRRGGEEVWLLLSEAVMRDVNGEVAGRIFAFRDISAEHAMETMRSEFVSAVSVDLRAPLTSIYGFAQTLLREDVAFSAEDRRRFLEFIAREAEHLTATVDSLLDVGRPQETLPIPEELVVVPQTEDVG
jgi:PAS domain S-box-containing protein